MSPYKVLIVDDHELVRRGLKEILRGTEKKTLYVPAIEQHDHMDELLDAVNPENSLIPRLGVLAIDITDDLRSRLSLLLP